MQPPTRIVSHRVQAYHGSLFAKKISRHGIQLVSGDCGWGLNTQTHVHRYHGTEVDERRSRSLRLAVTYNKVCLGLNCKELARHSLAHRSTPRRSLALGEHAALVLTHIKWGRTQIT
jgi:hypothetical protein